ncbi:MAG: cobalamin-dependent protein [Candidatus Omnitrophica bacterium]|nr:cobalamin-dependent protein [Candidatus Omnitrophota bacterium]
MKVLLVVYDNESYMHVFPLGLGYIAAVLRHAGHEVTVYSQDFHHYPDSHLTKYLDQNRFDLVGLGIISGYHQYRKLLAISKAINASRNRPFYVLGGHGPTPDTEFFLRKSGADAVVMGEGEVTIIELVNALIAGTPLAAVQGIAFRDGDKPVITPRRPLIEDVDSIPSPAYDLFPMEYYRLLRMPHVGSTEFVMPILSGRGCTFTCNFCYRMDQGFRPRKSEAIIAEMQRLQKDYSIGYFAFQDELLMSSVERTRDLCEKIISQGLKAKWECNGRLNYAKPELLKLMKEAGCVFINYGIESLDDQILKNMNKALTVKQINAGIEATLAAGISPGFNIIFGNIGETRDVLMKGVDFLIKYDDGSQLRTIRPVTPYPGSPLYDLAIKKGLLKDCEDFYENKHLNSDLVAVNFTDMSDAEFHQALLEANTMLIENYFRNKSAAVVEEARRLYSDGNRSFRGFRQL